MNTYMNSRPRAARLLLCGALLLTAAFATHTVAQETPAPAATPSRLRLESLEGLAAKSNNTIDVALDGAALRLATSVAGSEQILKNLPPGIDPALVRELLTNLQAVYVKQFNFAQPGAYTEANIEPVRTQLRAAGSGWSRIVGVNEPGATGEKIDVYVANDPARNDRLNGVAVLVQHAKELTVAYVVGTINTDTVLKVIDVFQKMGAAKSPGNSSAPKKTNP